MSAAFRWTLKSSWYLVAPLRNKFRTRSRDEDLPRPSSLLPELLLQLERVLDVQQAGLDRRVPASLPLRPLHRHFPLAHAHVGRRPRTSGRPRARAPLRLSGVRPRRRLVLLGRRRCDDQATLLRRSPGVVTRRLTGGVGAGLSVLVLARRGGGRRGGGPRRRPVPGHVGEGGRRAGDGHAAVVVAPALTDRLVDAVHETRAAVAQHEERHDDVEGEHRLTTVRRLRRGRALVVVVRTW